jgi:hypothetical protein
VKVWMDLVSGLSSWLPDGHLLDMLSGGLLLAEREGSTNEGGCKGR